MRAAIDIECQGGVWARLRIVNDGSEPAPIHNPGDYSPTDGWEFSREAYRIAVLRSFHFLQMTLRADDGATVQAAGLFTRANHLVGLPIKLEPGEELVIPIPLHEFYDLDADKDYSLDVTYGDDSVRVSASARVRCP
jgi:hypothetical protein